MNEQQFRDLISKGSASVQRLNPLGPLRVHSSDQKPNGQPPLVHPKKGKAKSSARTVARYRIRFTIYAVRPADWDGWSIKQLQDCCIHAGLIHGDAWHVLEGSVRSEKVHSEEEERTVIEILPPIATSDSD